MTTTLRCMAILGLLLTAAMVGCDNRADQLREAGISSLQIGQVDRAQKDLEESAGLEPGNAETHYFLGRSYHVQGFLEQAVYQYQCALEIDPGYSRAKYWLNEATAQLGRTGEVLRFIPHLPTTTRPSAFP